MAFTYDISTDLGKVRFLIVDVVSSAYTFEDAELQYLLDKNVTVDLAAAEAYEIWARDKSRISKLLKSGTFTSERVAIADLLKNADRIRNAPLKGTLQSGELASANGLDYLDEFRPLDRNIEFDLTVE